MAIEVFKKKLNKIIDPSKDEVKIIELEKMAGKLTVPTRLPTAA